MEHPVSLSSYERAAQEIQPLLRPKEQLLWAGQPQQGVHFALVDLISMASSLPLLVALGLMGTVLLTSSTFSLYVQLIAIPIWLAFFYLLVGRFIVAAYLRSQVFYGLTSKSVIIRRRGVLPRTQIMDINALSAIDIQMHGGKRHGTITFGKRERPWQGVPTLSLNQPPPRLEYIEDAAAVCDEIDRLRVAARSRL